MDIFFSVLKFNSSTRIIYGALVQFVYTWKEATDKFKGFCTKKALSTSHRHLRLNLRCAVFSFNGFLLQILRRRKRAWRVKSCSGLSKWSICDVRLSHGVVLECRLNAASFTC